MALKDAQVQKFFDRKKNRLNTILGSLTEDKPEPKWRQSRAKVETQLEPKPNITEVKVEPDQQSGANVETQLESTKKLTRDKPEAKWSQKKEVIKNHVCFSQLVGLQKKIIIFIYENCKISRCNESQQLTVDFINSYCKTTKSSIKKAIQRLIKKGCLIRKSFKDGRSGWTTYEFPDYLYYEIIHIESKIKLEPNWSQSRVNIETQLGTQPESTIASSSCINIKTTTTDNAVNVTGVVISEEWQNIDIVPLSQIGFTITHLNQIALQNKLSSQIVQDSIYAFAFDLENNAKAKTIKGDPINFFMGILRNGKPYLSPSNYESPQDKAMRLYMERKRETEQKRLGIEKEAISLAFGDWFAQLTDNQKREFLPEMFRNTPRLEKNKLLESSARNHFEAEVWATKKNEILQKNIIEPGEVIKETDKT